jgi:hypothetical protein
VFALLLTVLQRGAGGRPAPFCPQVQPRLFTMVARRQVEDEVPAAVTGGPCADGDDVAPDGGGAGLRGPGAGAR